ncbi:unnamed protein product, partial [Ectocarpus sp. 8 AP-2014]
STSRSPRTVLSRGDSGLRSREAKPRSSPKKGFLRGMMMPARLKMKHQGGGDSATAAVAAAAAAAEVDSSASPRRGRAMTSMEPSDEADMRRRAGRSPLWALERRSSAAGYEG